MYYPICETVRDLEVRYLVVEDLCPGEKSMVEDHLESCSRCRGFYSQASEKREIKKWKAETFQEAA